MAHPDPAQLRNVAVLGHRGSGKTSLVEAMLFAAGSTTRLGRVGEGTTVCDFDEDEQRRGMSISASLCHLDWGGVKVNLVDTPGEPSFQGDTLAALRAVDSALMVVNAASGVEVQTERYWNRAAELGLPRAVVINMLDRERADFDAVVAAIVELAPGAVPIQIPIGSEAGFRGVVNLVSMTATTYAGDPASATTGPIPDELAGAAQAAREHLIDMVAESDDALIEKYLEGEEITTDELIAAILVGVEEGRIFPVVCAAGASGIGADRVLDLITEALPSPAQAGGADADGPAVALCFKTLADQFSGRISLLRVFSGVLPSDSHATCQRGDAKERVGQLFTLQGKEHVPLTEIGPGDIGAVAKLKEVGTGDVLVTGPTEMAFDPIALPPALMSFAVTARDAGRRGPLHTALRRMSDEDPTLDVHHDDQTGDLIVGGLSQMHVEVLAGRIEKRFGVAMDLAPPHVPYRETITRSAEAEGKHKKQSGGRGQYADCWIRIEPLPRGAGFEFVDKVVGGAIPRSFIPAVEKGVVEAMRAGELAGDAAGGPAGDPPRRQAPPGGLVGDGLQDRGRAGPAGGRGRGGTGAAGAGHAGRDHGPPRPRRRRDGRSQRPAGPPAGDGGARARRDRAGRGADGRDARLRRRPARHDRRSRRLRDGVRPLRPGAGPPGREGRPGGRRVRGPPLG